MPPPLPAFQRSLDDLGQPLSSVTFVVVDLETTGAAPSVAAITEVGAVKLRGGVALGTFQTLVNPGMEIPREIVYLTGISDVMVAPAPPIGGVLSSLMEFIGDAVVVGHNVRFDVSFLDAELMRRGLPRIGNPIVDTCALARRLVRDEVPDCRLHTLARHLRLDHVPSHRALADALATGDLLHLLLERAGTLGVLGLDDLMQLPRMAGHPQADKLRLTTTLPRTGGVYLFLDGSGHVIYVGKAANLRQRVRSYFSTDERRKIGSLLRLAAAVQYQECPGPLHSLALETRLIHRYEPRFNRHAKAWRRYAYVKLTLDERFPRLAVARRARPGDGCLYVGPLGSVRAARQLIEAIEAALPVRPCRGRIGRRSPRAEATRVGSRPEPRHHCPTRALGLRACPCTGEVSDEEYRPVVDRLVRGLTVDPESLLEPLRARMRALAEAERFEEAAETRDRGALLARVLTRQRRNDALRAAGRVRLLTPDGGLVEVHEGRVRIDPGLVTDRHAAAVVEDCAQPGGTEWPWPLRPDDVDEVAAVSSWLEGNAHRLTLLEAEHGWAQPAFPIASFDPGSRDAPTTHRGREERSLSGRFDGGRL